MFDLFMVQKEWFFQLLIEHIYIVLLSCFIAMIIGGIIGIFIAEYNKYAKVILTVVNALYTIPSIAMLGFLIPLCGIGNNTAITAMTIYALLPMVRNTYTGISTIDESIVELAVGLGSTKAQVLYKVKLPLAMPIIIAGIRSMIVMTVALTGIASFVGAGGLGVAIYRGITTNNNNLMLLGGILVAILAIVIDLLCNVIERDLLSRKSKKKYLILCIIPLLIIGNLFIGTIHSNKIRIATKPMTEQFILGEMLKLLIEQETDLEVSLTQGVGGGTSNIWSGMISDEFDLYPEYTGTGWNMILKDDSLYSEQSFNEMNELFEQNYSMQWVGMYGFNNTYSIAVRSELANEYNLKTYSDLTKIDDFAIFGGEYDFYGRLDGYEGLCILYNLDFKNTTDMDIGLKYKAINSGEIDVMPMFTTDGQLSQSDIVILEDDLNLFPSYLCGNIIRNDTLKEHPELYDVLMLLEHRITDELMASMNYKVESEGIDASVVAYEFLVSEGLIYE